jgi:4-amino-4-deoxy-L-arabinose transferase-like glycosyltransferase
MIRVRSIRFKDLVLGISMLIVILYVALTHRWFLHPWAVWIGCDEAYVAAFGQRMLQGHWMPYVDAVSHRGPVLYWISAFAQMIGAGHGWASIRAAAFLLSEASVVLLFALGVVGKRPLAGLIGAAVFAWELNFALPPIDGIALNGELVSVPLVLGAMVLAAAGLREGTRAESRVWMAAGSGLLVALGALSKQPAALHLLPVALWWGSGIAAQDRPLRKRDWRPLAGLAVGALTPVLAVVSFYARAGQLRTLVYYLVTYNRKVYLAPITPGFAIEATYGFVRNHAELVILTVIAAAWWLARLVSSTERLSSPGSWLRAWGRFGLLSTVTLNALVALAGAFSTFRFFEHYFVTAVPWLAMLAGLVVEEQVAAMVAARAGRERWTTAIVAGALVLTLLICGKVHLHWLDGQRKVGFFGNPDDEPITNYVKANTGPNDRIFAWGFAPEYYVSTGRRAASRFVYTTFVAGLVPWFDRLTVEQEDALSVPGSRDLLIRELELENTELVLDIPDSLRNRGMRRYEQLAEYLERSYCFEATIVGRNARTADIYRRKRAPCARPLPPR